jgi:pimeloyl-ACP methyl ester carboxylesterase
VRRRLVLVACAALTAVSAVVPTAAQAQARTPLPVENNFLASYLAHVDKPATPPPGANDWACESRLHPTPVILVHGTWEHQAINWQAFSPYLKNRGYCVYTFNYGGRSGDLLWGYRSVASNAQELSDFVDLVRSRTGAAKVDLVGHSQGGGPMPRYYIKFLGGSAKVGKLIGLTPSNHGTTVGGLAELMETLGLVDYLEMNQPGLSDQLVGSALIKRLDTCPGGPDADICPGDRVRYTVIATKHDQVVTPYANGFLKGAKNITIQDVCPIDNSEHLAISYDSNAQQLVANALDPAHAKPVRCSAVYPLIGG